MKNLVALIAILVSLSPFSAYSKDESVPTMTATYRSPNGAEVSVTYEAIRWDPKMFTMLQSTASDADTEQLRGYYNKYVTPRLAQLSTNVTLRGRSFTLAPGIYRIGFVADGPKWLFVAGNKKGRQVEVPMTWNTQPFETGRLSFLLVPGVSPDALQLVILYGPHTVAQGGLLTGEPTQIKPSKPPLYKYYFGGVGGEEIPPVTPEAKQKDWRLRTLGGTPTPRPSSSLGSGTKRGSLR